jgi:2-amino-4-hydroxy-6-hydroxymethyldihydropteridine diphosphokinase
LDPFSDYELGERWRKKFYSIIRDSLGFEEQADRECRDLLYELLLNFAGVSGLSEVENRIRGRKAIIFGAGPSLESDLEGLKEFVLEKRPILVAADGAADALREFELQADMVVSDLDSCSVETLRSSAEKGFVFAHAHGGNKDLVRTVIPQMRTKNVFGTTQVEERGYIRNFGGFTDGDRACFVTAFFAPSRVILAGMDFGKEEGSFSINKYKPDENPKRLLKLEWGKKSLEYLISERDSTCFQNVTRFGVEIRGAPRIPYRGVTREAV